MFKLYMLLYCLKENTIAMKTFEISRNVLMLYMNVIDCVTLIVQKVLNEVILCLYMRIFFRTISKYCTQFRDMAEGWEEGNW